MEGESKSNFGHSSVLACSARHTDTTVPNMSHQFAPWKKEFVSEIGSLYRFRNSQIILSQVS